MTRLVLGSASPARLNVLRQAGVEPLVVISGVDEDAVVAELRSPVAPGDVVRALARAKAEQVAAALNPPFAADAVVVGCDSMLYVNGQLSGKPQSVAEARRQWQSMAGQRGELYTGHCVIRLLDAETVRRTDETTITTVYFGKPSAADLEAYLASGESLQVAGAFTLDGLGGWFVDRIDGDPSNVIGLSLPTLRSLLRRVGLSVAALWAGNAGD
ncbi:Maf-like protein YceF [Mycobacterium basiliense]|uniref:Nucleoside triphosphate pyrophosphatase n=1 Tax=Mycobacterium basiliense TaxID=2094119 RepID=A0A447GAW6_9MYCO|nr:nucleoside triphosphate pyrophosphatase [Mycobacterium basiliense]VDM87606.1 Maf-like protein YceF [Mycobacterium basiliense]